MGTIEVYIYYTTKAIKKLSEREFTVFLRQTFSKPPVIVKQKEVEGNTPETTYYLFAIQGSDYSFKCNRRQLRSLINFGLVQSAEYKITRNGKLISAKRTEVQGKQDKSFKTDKKKNAAYWDVIDDTVETCITDILAMSAEKVDADELDLYGDGIIGEVRDLIIDYLKEQGAEFPFVDGDM